MNKKATIRFQSDYCDDDEALSYIVDMNSGERFDLRESEGLVDMLRFLGVEDVTVTVGY